MSGIHLLLILSSVLTLGTALICYECQSASSWDDCKKNSLKRLCMDSYITKCGKVKITTTDESTGNVFHAYAKGCANTCDTNDIETCRDGHLDGNPVTCTMHCCSGDYCNTGASLVASIIIPAICALISVVFTI